MFDKLLEFVVTSVKAEEKAKQDKIKEAESKDFYVPRPYNFFWAECDSGELIEPCRKKATHHREREAYWTGSLEIAEIELREKGVSVEVYDQQSQTYMNMNTHVSSGGLTGNITQNFQPRVDPKMLDNVKNCKNKMLEHREKAIQYEKLARAFSFNPAFRVRLTIDDIHYFGLEA